MISIVAMPTRGPVEYLMQIRTKLTASPERTATGRRAEGTKLIGIVVFWAVVAATVAGMLYFLAVGHARYE
jgi:hypothetical protein